MSRTGKASCIKDSSTNGVKVTKDILEVVAKICLEEILLWKNTIQYFLDLSILQDQGSMKYNIEEHEHHKRVFNQMVHKTQQHTNPLLSPEMLEILLPLVNGEEF